MILKRKLQFNPSNRGDYDEVIAFLIDQGYKWSSGHADGVKRPFIYTWPDGDITTGTKSAAKEGWEDTTIKLFTKEVYDQTVVRLTPEIQSEIDSLDTLFLP